MGLQFGSPQASPTLIPALAVPAQFGEEGEGAGQFAGGERGAKGIAIDQEDGDVYLADTGNNRVAQFTASGDFIRAFGFGVADGKSESFQVCNAPGPCFAGLPGSAGGPLSQPEGIAVDNSGGPTHGAVYVQDRLNNRVARYGPNGEFMLTFGGEVNKTKVKEKEEGVAVTEAEEDVCTSLSGDVCQAGTPGTGPAQFADLMRNGIAVGPGGTVYVADLSRVQKFAASGAPEGELALPEVNGDMEFAGAIEGLAVDSSGDLYVLREQPVGVQKYDGVTGTELGEVRDPGVGGLIPSIAVGPSDELFVSDGSQGRLLAYDSAGTQLTSVPLPESSGVDASGGIAFGGTAEALYVIHHEPAHVALLTLPPPGPLILEAGATEVTPTSATLDAKVNPEGPELTRYHFDYGTTNGYGSETAEALLAGAAFEDQSAAAQISGLQPNTTYHFRAVATNGTETTFGSDQTFTTDPPVSVDGESVAAVSGTGAKLIAELNAHGLPSTFHFEYGLTTGYEQGAVPIPDASAGQGAGDATFSVKLQELLADHTYHFRVVARNALGVSVGADQTFQTQGEGPVLADGRAYEMLSPPVKHGVSLEAITLEGGLIQAAADGSGLAYIALGPIDTEPKGNRSSQITQLLAKRTAGVWSTQDIATPHQALAGVSPGNPSEYKQFSSDLSRAGLEPEGKTPLSPQAGERTPYRFEPDGSFAALVDGENTPAGTKFGGTEGSFESFERGVTYVTGTPDMRHVLLTSPSALGEGFETSGTEAVYEWSEGKLEPVSILPGGAPASAEGRAFAGNKNRELRGAVSDDGSRAIFDTEEHDRLYLRDLRLGGHGETLRLDAAEAGLEASLGGAVFQLANGDASKVFFTDATRLTKDATAKGSAADLYECTVVIEGGKLACRLRDLSVDPHVGEAADVQGTVLGADQSGRYVYFVARGALTEGAVSGSCPNAGEGKCLNLYEFDTQTDTKRLVAVLSEADAPDWEAGGGVFSNDLGQVTSRVSPDGRFLAFMSERPLTGFDNRDASILARGARDEEVFLYDNETGDIRCASCDPSGARPAGAFDEGVYPGALVDRPQLWRGRWLAASIPGWTRINLGYALHQSSYLSDQGRLFFNSPVGLVAGDGNGTQDVYEYEPATVGGCASAEGCVNLISSGSSSEESAFLDASENGGDVFFLTAAQLSLADKDNAFDVYDAHVCSEGGCPAQAVGSPPPCASADACRAAPSPQPGAFSAPASSTFSGAGNPTPPPTAPSVKAKGKSTRAQQLAKALRACEKKPKRRRPACRREASMRFGPVHTANKKNLKANNGRQK